MVLTMSPGLNTSNKMKLIVQSTELLAKESENAFIPDNYEWHHVYGGPNQEWEEGRKASWWELRNDREDIIKLLNLSKKASDMRNIANKTAIEKVAFENYSKIHNLESNVNLINHSMNRLEKEIVECKTQIKTLIQLQKSLIQLEEAKNNLNKYTNDSFIEIIYWIVFLVSHILVIGFLLIVIHELTHYFKTSIAISNI
jgi:hypothetical protein